MPIQNITLWLALSLIPVIGFLLYLNNKWKRQDNEEIRINRILKERYGNTHEPQ